MSTVTDLVDRLGATALECRELLRELHSAQKALRHDVKEAQRTEREMLAAIKLAVAEAVTTAAGAMVADAVDGQIDILHTGLAQAVANAEERVFARMVAKTDPMTAELKVINGYLATLSKQFGPGDPPDQPTGDDDA